MTCGRRRARRRRARPGSHRSRRRRPPARSGSRVCTSKPAGFGPREPEPSIVASPQLLRDDLRDRRRSRRPAGGSGPRGRTGRPGDLQHVRRWLSVFLPCARRTAGITEESSSSHRQSARRRSGRCRRQRRGPRAQAGRPSSSAATSGRRRAGADVLDPGHDARAPPGRDARSRARAARRRPADLARAALPRGRPSSCGSRSVTVGPADRLGNAVVAGEDVVAPVRSPIS